MVDNLIMALDEFGMSFIEDPDISLEPEPVGEEVKQAQAESGSCIAGTGNVSIVISRPDSDVPQSDGKHPATDA